MCNKLEKYLTLLIIIERIFYLSTHNKKTYFILFSITIFISLVYIFIKWIINYKGILGINTDEDIAEEIGQKDLLIKDRLLNVIQLNKSHKDLDLTKLAVKNIEGDITQNSHKMHIKYLD